MVKMTDLIKGETKKKERSSYVFSKFISDKEFKEKEQKRITHNFYELGCRYIQENIDRVREERIIAVSPLAKIVTRMVEDKEFQDRLYYNALYTKTTKEELLASHLMNTAIYAIKIGLGLRYSDKELIRIGIAGMVYDLGMAKIPKEILNKKEKLTEREVKIVQQHTVIGYKLLQRLGTDYKWLAEVALQHHERENGCGYPKGLKGDQIIPYAKIIGIADVYEAMTHVRPQREPFLPFVAIREIVQSQKGLFDFKTVKALLSQLSVFPVGSYVKLNNNSIGQVVETTEREPLRPKIKILFDSQGSHVEKEEYIDLKDSHLLYVVDSVYEEDLPH
ncbi:MAG: HD-GYP domain-containing protein [Deltaproteobacteria bacterium]|nr:HD-GYP domain-containing protein [Deltaproteobacteria bacterium]